MPLTPRQMRENLARRFAETYEEDERVAAELRAKMPEAVRLITEALGPRRIVLYGSLATGLFRAAQSDVDLAIEGIAEEPPQELAVALLRLFGRKADVVDPDWVAPHVRRQIAERGIVLHEPSGKG